MLGSHLNFHSYAFQVAETEEEEKERLANWDKFLNEEEESAGEVKKPHESAASKA